MDKISELLQEARPLYKTRKRNKAVAKVFLTIAIPVFLFTSIFGIYTLGDNIYVSMNNEELAEQLLLDDYGLFGVK